MSVRRLLPEGTGAVVRLGLRRDRVLLGAWAGTLTLVVYASAAATDSLFADPAQRALAARAVNDSRALVALYGPILDPASPGELAMSKLTVLYALLVAVLALLVVRRRTRAEEETGRAELLGATPVGRQAPLAAAAVLAVATSLAAGALAALADLAGGLPVTGSLLFGASWAGTGLVGTGLALVACQLSSSSRTCAELAGAAVLVLYGVRGVADATTGLGWLGWLSPFGWSTRMRAWTDPRPEVLLLYPVLAGLLGALAVALRARRDLGSGLLGTRPGPPVAPRWLTGPLGLAWRLDRVQVVGWSVAAAGSGALIGAIAPSTGDLFDSEQGARLLADLGGRGALEDALVGAVLSLMGLAVAAFGLVELGRVATDETEGRDELLATAAVPRSRLLLARAVVAVVGSAWLLGLTGLAAGLALGRAPGPYVVAGLALAPAAWVVIGVGALLVAARPAWAPVGWLVLVALVVVDDLGAPLGLPGWVRGLSPYDHVPATLSSSAHLDGGATAASTLVALVLGLAAWARYRTRDLGR